MMYSKKIADMTTSEKAEAFIDRVIFDKDNPPCAIEREMRLIETSCLQLWWQIGPIMEGVLSLLRARGFNFCSTRGLEFLDVIKKRVVFPEKYGYELGEVIGLYFAVKRYTGLCLWCHHWSI